MTLPSAVASATGIPPHPRSRLRARLVLAGLSACGLAALAWASFVHPLPRLIYNPSDSVAVGWYRVDPQGHGTGSLPRPLSVGSIVLTTLPPDAAALPARGYLPARVPLLKRGRRRAAGVVQHWPRRPHRRRAFGRRAACRPLGPAAAILAAMPPPRIRRTVPLECDQPGVVRQPVFRAGQRIRRDRGRASSLAGIPPMMAADSLHVAVHLVVPSGVSLCWPSPCRRACSAGAFAPHFALPSAQPSNVQASCLERARPMAVAAFAGALAARAAAPPGRRCPERQRGAKAEGKKGRGTGPRRKPVCTWGWRGTQASPPCRVRREARADAGMSACFARPDTPELARSTAMTDRRDDDFRIRPSAPKNRGQSFVSKVLKQAGKASSGKSAVRRPGGSSKSAGSGQRPGSRLGRGHTAARFAGRSSRPCRGV